MSSRFNPKYWDGGGRDGGAFNDNLFREQAPKPKGM